MMRFRRTPLLTPSALDRAHDLHHKVCETIRTGAEATGLPPEKGAVVVIDAGHPRAETMRRDFASVGCSEAQRDEATGALVIVAARENIASALQANLATFVREASGPGV